MDQDASIKTPGYYAKIAAIIVVAVLAVSAGLIYLLNTFHYGNVLDASGAIENDEPTLYEVGDTITDLNITTIDEGDINISEFQGEQNTLLVFWATWCTWCARELPDLKSLTDEYRDDIKVIAIDRQEPESVIRSYIEKNQPNFTIGLDPKLELSKLFAVQGTPTHVYINKSGTIIKIVPGYEEPSKLRASFEQLVAAN